ncbi:MAG: inositol monophosphatase family protein [Desulfomonile sp.]
MKLFKQVRRWQPKFRGDEKADMKDGINGKEIHSFLDMVTKKAGGKLLSYFQGKFRIDRKDTSVGGIDIVTDADRASEEIILEAIGREFPSHDILTEETVTEMSGSSWLWLVDPLDGTVNFAHGFPHFCISIALMHKEILLAGIVYDPLRQETFFTMRGSGAYLNGKPAQVSRADRLGVSIIATGFPYDRAYSAETNVAEFTRVVTRVQGIRRAGSAALDLAYVSYGRMDGFWELKLKPWDQAAGMLLVEEAGGRVTDRTGNAADVYSVSVVATNGIIHEELLAAIEGNLFIRPIQGRS